MPIPTTKSTNISRWNWPVIGLYELLFRWLACFRNLHWIFKLQLSTYLFWVDHSLGMNCSIFTNCSVFLNVRHVRSLDLGKKYDVWNVRNLVLMFEKLSKHLKITFWAMNSTIIKEKIIFKLIELSKIKTFGQNKNC